MPSKNLSARSKALLDAQVKFYVDQLTTADVKPFLSQQVSQSLIRAKCVKLDDLADTAVITRTLQKYLCETEQDEATPDLFRQIAKQIYHHEMLDQYQLSDLQTDEQYQKFLVQIAEHEEIRQHIIAEVVSNPLYASLMSDMLYHGIQDYITENPLTKKIPGAQSMMKFGKSMMDLASPKIEATIKKYVEANIRVTLKQSERFLNKNLSNEKVVELGMNAWQENRDKQLSFVRKHLDEEDVHSSTDLGYQYWLSLREGDFFRQIIKSSVDFMFDYYGDLTLFELLEKASVTEESLLDDVLALAPGALENLNEKGLLDEIIRQLLLPFFNSTVAQSLLAD